MDPGARVGAAGAGDPLSGLTAARLAAFEAGKSGVAEAEGVADGLGPRFNLDSWVSCHVQPAVGGTSPSEKGTRTPRSDAYLRLRACKHTQAATPFAVGLTAG
jgi:CxxC motif-containing protein (DUF1111 family)